MTTPADARYRARGVSSAKEDVHQAIAHLDAGLFPGAFCKVLPDLLSGDPESCLVLHADGAGTKSSLAYLAWRESGDVGVWKGIAQDSLVMNLDDCACAGAIGPYLVSNTIGRNAKRIPGEVIAAIIAGYGEVCASLEAEGITCHLAGGETADVGDLVRTVIVDSTIACRLPRREVIDASRMAAGDVIIGFSSTGRARWEGVDNAGIGSNGLTGARHELLAKHYAQSYPESHAPEIDPDFVYSGPYRLQDPLPDSSMSIGQALLSPTRTYVPLIRDLIDALGVERIHGLIHASGGAHAKIGKFGHGKRYILDALPPPPPLFRAIQAAAQVDWREMYTVYNCGVRLLAVVPEACAQACLDAAKAAQIDSWVVGRVEDATAGAANSVHLQTAFGDFSY
ncbi:MAG: phosphoribosylformylglycinamidine cyclo-ligase [Planctomycetota bacterium]|nr:MAG: phosphoribosylformylglycinamidine cyclo-ligase [Planctomycetota bacterium]